MLQWDLTALVDNDALGKASSEGELFVLLVALLLFEGRAYADLRGRTLGLTLESVDQVAKLIEEQLQPFARDIGTGFPLRQRLAQLAGIKVARLA